MRNTPSFDRILGADRPRSQAQPVPTQPVEGTIATVDRDRCEATFIVEAFHNGLYYGPAPYGLQNAATPPQPGQKCLVVFVGNGVDRAWIMSWALSS